MLERQGLEQLLGRFCDDDVRSGSERYSILLTVGQIAVVREGIQVKRAMGGAWSRRDPTDKHEQTFTAVLHTHSISQLDDRNQ